MKLFDNIFRRIGYLPQEHVERRMNRLQRMLAFRSYTAAATIRLVGDWSTTATSIESDIRAGLVAVRARARDLVQNDDYAKRYVSEVRVNVVGSTGFKMQANVREPVTVTTVDAAGSQQKTTKIVSDKLANIKIEEAFGRWTQKKNCSLNGRRSFRSICENLLTYAARDGEFLVRMHYNKTSLFGFQLEIIPPEFLDETYNTRLENGNAVKMGVEVDSTRRPVAYWIRKARPELEVYGMGISGGERERVPAEEIIHGFDQEYENQTRGISWMVQSMYRLKMLSAYDEAELVQARIGASAGGFFYDEKDSAEEVQFDATDSEGNKTMDMQPGIFRDIGGKRFTPFDPKHPTTTHGDFVRTQAQRISAGLDLAYASLTNDLSDANYSSNRVGLVAEREKWKRVQQWFTEMFLELIFERWLEMAIISGQLALPMAKFDKFNQPAWIGRRWAWIDPLKEAQANLLLLQARLTSHYQLLGEQGEDPEEVFDDIKAIEDLAKEKGITLDLLNIKVPGDSAGGDQSANAPKGTAPKVAAGTNALVEPTNGQGEH